jgi:predicted TIM-barrel fold metal-dependent hydrolase
MDVVDTQIHLFMPMTDDVAVDVMDNIGVASALIDECWDFGDGTANTPRPRAALPNGEWRPLALGSVTASQRRPDRFGFILRINPHDPDLEAVMAQAKAAGVRAFRLEDTGKAQEAEAAAGDRLPIFRLAEKLSVPLKVCSIGRAPLYEPYIRACPDLTVILDHCGAPRDDEDFAATLKLSAYPNVYYMWCHAPLMFSAMHFPFAETRPYLDRALEAFGREHVFWGSDFTAVDHGARLRNVPLAYTWADALYAIRCNPGLSEDDQAWILGRSARQALAWPRPAAS